MDRISTEQFGVVRISFTHHTGDPRRELLRALRYQLGNEIAADYPVEGYTDPVKRRNYIKSDVADAIETYEEFLDNLMDTGIVSIRIDAPRMTEAKITFLEKKPLSLFSGTEIDSVEGYSYVHPKDTHYVKEIGRENALKNALENIPDATEKTKRQVMSGYYNR